MCRAPYWGLSKHAGSVPIVGNLEPVGPRCPYNPGLMTTLKVRHFQAANRLTINFHGHGPSLRLRGKGSGQALCRGLLGAHRAVGQYRTILRGL